MRALVWTNVNLEKGQLCVERNDWRGEITTTKGNRLRHIPLTRRLADALRGHRHLRGPLVLMRPDGRRMSESALQQALKRAARRTNLRYKGPHMLKHTFCSHLAMRGAAPKAIQELAAHRHLATTMRYMHLSPAAKDSAIRLLERSANSAAVGDMLETGDPAI